ncbi:hypothetical protein F9C11_31635 [Amycolatopsis sp. VS8301801F10]|uniref:hypothetical protein n=1 Tax=Amycolatopsis sp. VS8301801F10 TaxID=2652442 RepID=UPI0038FCD95F
MAGAAAVFPSPPAEHLAPLVRAGIGIANVAGRSNDPNDTKRIATTDAAVAFPGSPAQHPAPLTRPETGTANTAGRNSDPNDTKKVVAAGAAATFPGSPAERGTVLAAFGGRAGSPRQSGPPLLVHVLPPPAGASSSRGRR